MITGIKRDMFELVGKGSFSTVYRKSEKEVLIFSNDKVKECMSLGFFPSCRLFPKVINTNNTILEKPVYTMKYYKKVSSLKNTLEPKEYSFYKELRKLYNDNLCIGYNNLYKLFNSLPSKYKYKKSLLLNALNGLINYGDDMRFEISPRNVTVNNGKLILLDCFYFSSQLEEVRRKRKY